MTRRLALKRGKERRKKTVGKLILTMIMKRSFFLLGRWENMKTGILKVFYAICDRAAQYNELQREN